MRETSKNFEGGETPQHGKGRQMPESTPKKTETTYVNEKVIPSQEVKPLETSGTTMVRTDIPGGPMRQRPIEVDGKLYDPFDRPRRVMTVDGVKYIGGKEVSKEQRDEEYTRRFWMDQTDREGKRAEMQRVLSDAIAEGQFVPNFQLPPDGTLPESVKETLSAYSTLARESGYELSSFKRRKDTGQLYARITRADTDPDGEEILDDPAYDLPGGPMQHRPVVVDGKEYDPFDRPPEWINLETGEEDEVVPGDAAVREPRLTASEFAVVQGVTEKCLRKTPNGEGAKFIIPGKAGNYIEITPEEQGAVQKLLTEATDANNAAASLEPGWDEFQRLYEEQSIPGFRVGLAVTAEEGLMTPYVREHDSSRKEIIVPPAIKEIHERGITIGLVQVTLDRYGKGQEEDSTARFFGEGIRDLSEYIATPESTGFPPEERNTTTEMNREITIATPSDASEKASSEQTENNEPVVPTEDIGLTVEKAGATIALSMPGAFRESGTYGFAADSNANLLDDRGVEGQIFGRTGVNESVNRDALLNQGIHEVLVVEPVIEDVYETQVSEERGLMGRRKAVEKRVRTGERQQSHRELVATGEDEPAVALYYATLDNRLNALYHDYSGRAGQQFGMRLVLPESAVAPLLAQIEANPQVLHEVVDAIATQQMGIDTTAWEQGTDQTRGYALRPPYEGWAQQEQAQGRTSKIRISGSGRETKDISL